MPGLSTNPRKRWFASAMLLVSFSFFATAIPALPSADERATLKSSDPLPDLSGLAWMGGDQFITVHDAKNPDELDSPRVSLMALPDSLKGVLWRPMAPTFPSKKSSDLESASRIPGTNQVLLVESTDNGSAYNRIFLGELKDGGLKILGATDWSTFTKSHNVEATAVASTGNGELIFIWAERNSGKTSTDIKWTKLSVAPFKIGGGAVSAVPFALPEDAVDANGKPLYDRPLVAMDVDQAGRVYIAATFDPEGTTPTPDNGPFRSVIYRIGRIADAKLVLDAKPVVVGLLDGLKVESVAIREAEGRRELYVGTDDENYGGILRVLPMGDF